MIEKEGIGRQIGIFQKYFEKICLFKRNILHRRDYYVFCGF